MSENRVRGLAEPSVDAQTGSDQSGWVLVGATALGTAHDRNGLPCQDRVAWWSGTGGDARGIVAIAALADGAGSARLAELGSQTAVSSVVRLVQCLAGAVEPANDQEQRFLIAASDAVARAGTASEALFTNGAASTGEEDLSGETDQGGHEPDRDQPGTENETTDDDGPAVAVPAGRLTRGEAEARCYVVELFAGARRAVEAAAVASGASVHDLATTLMVVLVTADAVVPAQIGDGVVAVRSSAGALLGPAAPQRGEFANEATFLTTGEDISEISMASFPATEVNAFGLSSDGMRLLITANPVLGTPYAPFFDEAFNGVASGVSSEALADFLVRAEDRTGDDKSLLIGVRVP